MHWMAYHLVRMVNDPFVCLIKATEKKLQNNLGTMLVSSFSSYSLIALLVRLAVAPTNSIRSALPLVGSHL